MFVQGQGHTAEADHVANPTTLLCSRPAPGPHLPACSSSQFWLETVKTNGVWGQGYRWKAAATEPEVKTISEQRLLRWDRSE